MAHRSLAGLAATVGLVLVALLAAAAPRLAIAGGSFARLIAVGQDGAWRELRLAPSGARGDASLFAGGRKLPLPTSGYVRLFPTLGDLPGVPGRYYPAEHVLCWSWRQPDRDCRRASVTAARLLEPLAALPPWRGAPTVVADLRFRGRRVRPALANLLVALELAFDRHGVAAATVPRSALRLTASWQGPSAASRPRRFALAPAGVYSGGRLYRLGRGVWSFAAANRVPGPTSAGLTVPAQPTPLYAITGPPPVGLVRVEPGGLRALPGGRVRLAGHTFGWSFSPDRSKLALGRAAARCASSTYAVGASMATSRSNSPRAAR